MKFLTKHTDYAIRALLALAADKNEFVSVKVIAGKQNIPYQFLRRILRELIKNKMVVSREGSGGGIKIDKSPASISLLEVISIFQGEIQLSKCMFRKKLCQNRARCVLRKQIKRIEGILSKEFEKITIESLLRDLRQQANLT